MKYFSWIAFFAVVIGLAVGGYFLVNNISSNPFKYKEVEEIVWKNVDITDFVEQKITCNKNGCKLRKKDISYTLSEIKTLGEQEVTLDINFDNKKYSKTFKVNVIDKESPTINLKEKVVIINTNEKFEAKNYIDSVHDNYDNLEIDNIDIDNQVDISKIGEYEVIYKILDSSKNEGISKLKVIVKDKKTPTETVKPQINSSDKNNESNSNAKEFSVEINTSGIYDLTKTLKASNNKNEITKNIIYTLDNEITFNYKLNGSGSYNISYIIDDSKVTTENPDFNNTISNGYYKYFDSKSENTINNTYEHKFSFDYFGTYYIFIKITDNVTKETLIQYITIKFTAPSNPNMQVSHTDKGTYEEFSYKYSGDTSDKVFVVLLVETNDPRIKKIPYGDDENDTLLINDGENAKLYFAKGYEYELYCAVVSAEKIEAMEIIKINK